MTTNAQTLPTAAYRTGNFSAALTGKKLGTDVMGNSILENEIYDPASATSTGYRTPFPDNIIPMSRLGSGCVKNRGADAAAEQHRAGQQLGAKL